MIKIEYPTMVPVARRIQKDTEYIYIAMPMQCNALSIDYVI